MGKSALKFFIRPNTGKDNSSGNWNYSIFLERLYNWCSNGYLPKTVNNVDSSLFICDNDLILLTAPAFPAFLHSLTCYCTISQWWHLMPFPMNTMHKEPNTIHLLYTAYYISWIYLKMLTVLTEQAWFIILDLLYNFHIQEIHNLNPNQGTNYLISILCPQSLQADFCYRTSSF